MSPSPNNPHPGYGTRVLRWTACVAVVGAVFFGARVTAQHAAEPEAAMTRPSMSERDTTAPSPGDSDEPRWEDLVDSLLPEDDTTSSQETEEVEVEEADSGNGWARHSGPAADGARWSVELPADWSVYEVDDRSVMADAVDYPRAFALTAYGVETNLEEAADFTLEEAEKVMVGVTNVSVEPFDHPDGDALRATFDYSNPNGFAATGTILWLQVDDVVYIVTVEWSLGSPQEEIDRIDRVVESFDIEFPA